MPDQETLERAREDAREGKSPSTQAGEFIREASCRHRTFESPASRSEVGNAERERVNETESRAGHTSREEAYRKEINQALTRNYECFEARAPQRGKPPSRFSPGEERRRPPYETESQ